MSTEHLSAGEQTDYAEQLREAARESKAARAHLVETIFEAKDHDVSNVQIGKAIGVTEAAVRAIIKRAQKA
ncbi:helix-turn-helix DNA binding domain protein [Arthrobacter phage Sonny]|uniref:Helix-turn-helix DNA binding domain protein n=1 Tax=Arthrobacter phage Sonny TaxID=1772315 RepID=A0A0U4K1E7_9CAUD|nr:HTH DNA binding protein [Arthrobacter phage Sonny]ALY10306.1 helix-turn-helix DNA binding domain protein [Arthrobacter phage Sonny]